MLLILFPLLTILFFTILIYHLLNYKNTVFNFPPGPKGFPFIGNLHQFDATKPHVYFANLAKTYGPIMGLRFGSVPIVVVQSAKLAKEVLQTQDLNFCSRPPMVGIQKLSYNGLDIAFAPYGDYFVKIKKIGVVHLLSSKRVESFANIRQQEVSRMIEKISSLSSTSAIVNLTDLLTSFARSNICRIAFGKRYEDDEGLTSNFHTLTKEAEVLFTTFSFRDYLPSIGWLDKLTGQFSRLEKTFEDLDAFYEEIINEHLNSNKKPKPEQDDIVDVLLQLMQEHSLQLTFDHVKAMLMVIFVAGTDTSSAMVVWAMAELMKNPNSMKKVQEELRTAISNKGFIENEDLAELVYFKALVKETLRLHPAAPLLIVRETIRKSTIQGYEILPKTLVYVNAWAIGRDPQCWKDPFGAGRRMCPGMHLGIANMELALANLLYSFDWQMPGGLKKEDIDIDTLPGINWYDCFCSWSCCDGCASRKRSKYADRCAALGYGFLPFSFSTFGEFKEDVVALLKRIQRFSRARDIDACAAAHIFTRIGFAISRGTGAQIASRLPTNFL